MPEVEGISEKETPQATHNEWFEKTLTRLGLVSLGFGTGITAVLNFVNEARTLKTIEAVFEIAEKVGGTVTPESIQPLYELARLQRVGWIAGVVAAGCFFTVSGASYLYGAMGRQKLKND